MDEQMIEEIAKAIYAKSPTLMFYDRPGSPPGNQYLDWEHAPQGCRDRAIEEARAAHSVMAGKVAEQRRALEAIDKTTFIGATTSSEETIRVALESAHDIARVALAPYPERR